MMQIYNIVWYFVTPTLQNPYCSAQNYLAAVLEVNAFGRTADAATREVIPSGLVAIGGLQRSLADAVDYSLDDFEGIEATAIGGVGAAAPVEHFIAIARVGLVGLWRAAHSSMWAGLAQLRNAPSGRGWGGGEDEGRVVGRVGGDVAVNGSVFDVETAVGARHKCPR